MHKCSGQIRQRFHSCFWSLCPVIFLLVNPSHRKFFPPVTVHDQQFGLHCSHGNSAFRRYQPRMLLATLDITLIWTRTTSFLIVLLFLPAGAILFPHCCHRYVVFRTFLSTPNTFWSAVSVFVVVTSACRITELHSAVLVFLYVVACCIRDQEIFTVAGVALLSFGVSDQRNTS